MTIETDGLSERDFREMAAKLEAARTMLATLEQAEAIVPLYMRGNLIERIRGAIAAAKAAGIK